MIEVNRLLFPIWLLLFAVTALLLPVLRVRRATGVLALTALRSEDTVERLMGGLLFVCLAGLAVWGGLYAWLGPGPLRVWALPAACHVAGWLLAVAGSGLMVAAQVQMGAAWRIGIDDAPTELVTSGLFRWVRNPIYTGMLVAVVGLLLVSPSPWTLGLAVAGSAAVHVQTRREEGHLRRQHGEAFERWAGQTGRFLPRIGRLG